MKAADILATVDELKLWHLHLLSSDPKVAFWALQYLMDQRDGRAKQSSDVKVSRAVVRFYNKRGTAEQWIKEGKQAVKMTRLLSSFPLEPSAAGAEPAGLQPGQFVAAAGVAQANRELVADQLAAAAGEDGWTVGETCPLLLAAVGGESSDAAAVWQHAAADGRAAAAG